MTADQQAADAFDREWQHALSSLPLRPCLGDHTAVLKHRRCELSIQGLLQYYSRKLPAYLYGPRLLSGGAQLQDRHDYRLAAELWFQRLVDLNLPGTPDSSRKLDAAARLGLHVQALYGLHASHAAEALLQDSSLQQQHTLTVVLAALAGLQAACQLVVPAQPLLVYEGTQHIHKVAVRLLPAGLHVQLLQHLLFAARPMECHISLSSMQYLPWRVKLYAVASECYYALLGAPATAAATPGGNKEAHSTAVVPLTPSQAADSTNSDAAVPIAEQATAVLAAGLSHLASIARAQALDAVPAPDITAAVQAAQAQLTLLQSLFEQQPAAGAGTDQAAAVSQLLASIKAIGSSEEQLMALLRLLQAGLAANSCPLQQVQLPANLQPAMAAAAELAAQVLGLATPGTGPETGAGTWQASTHQELLMVAYRYQQQDLLRKLLDAALDSTAAPESAAAVAASSHGQAVDHLVATAAVLDAVSKLHVLPGDSAMQHLAAVLVQHSEPLGSCSPSLLAAAALELHAAASQVLHGCFSHADSNAELAQALLEGLHAALHHAGNAVGVLKGSAALRLAALLEEQQQLGRGLEVVEQGLAAIVTARCDALTHLQGQVDEHLRWITGSRTQPDNATAALLEGMSDTEQVLACLHADAVLLRTRLQLKQGMHAAAAKATSRQQRMQATLQKRDQQADIFGARTQKERRLDAAAVQVAGLVPQTAVEVEQRLLQDCGGCPYQQALVLTATALVQPDVNRQTSLLEEACDALQAAHASEAELFAAQQPAAEALRPLSVHHIKPLSPKVLRRTPNSISLTVFPVKVAREARKPAAFAAYCKPCAAGVSLTVNKTSMEYPGSGVQVPIDGRVTIEGLQGGETYNFAVAVFDDQGTLLGELGASSPAITMTLPLPVYYCYAQVLLAAARLGLWTVAKGAAAVLLPRFFTTTAARPIWQAHPADRFTLQSDQVAAQVAPFLRLLVQAVYAYAGHLGTKQLTALQDGGSSSFDGMEEAAISNNGLAGTAASRALLLSLSDTHLPRQVALLEAARRHLLAMQVAAEADDEMLVEEGALRTLNLLRPLLQQQDISPTLLQPLAELHTLLAAVKDTAPSSVYGHKHQRQQAAQALATAGYWKLRLLEPVGPDLLCGSAAVAAHAVIGLQLQPSAALSVLDGALLRVLGGASPAAAAAPQETSSQPAKAGKGGKKQTGHKAGKKIDSIPEGSAVAGLPVPVGEGAEQEQELAALQELLLWHPQGALWAADLHATRCNDPNDLVAQVLPKLQQPQALTTCWPLLSAQAAYSHPKWLQLCVLLMQAASKQHGAVLWLCLPPADKAVNNTSNIGVAAESLPEAARAAATPQLVAAAAAASELLAAVKQHARMTARRPQFLAWTNSPKWTVDSAAAALEAEGFVLGDQGTAPALPQPEMPAGSTAAATKAATAAWQKQNADLLVQERRRLAAALLLQQRLPVLLGRRAAILAARQQLAAWAPWLGQLHSLVGSMAAEAAAQLLALKVPAVPVRPSPAAAEADVTQVQAAEAGTAATDPAVAAATHESAAAAEADPTAGEAPAAAAGAAAAVEGQPAAAGTAGRLTSASRPGSPRKGVLEGTKAEGQAAGAACGSKADTLDSLAQLLALQAHQQFARAATLTARSSSHLQLFNTSKQLQGISTYLLNKIPGLLQPVPAVKWTIQPLPEPSVPPLLATAPERPVTDPATGGKGAERRSTAGGKAPADKKQAGVPAAKGAPGRPSATPRADAKHTLLPEPCAPHVGAALRSVAAALLAAMQQLRSQLSPVPRPTADSGSTGQAAARSYATSFSFGSDALIEAWHTGSGVDVTGLTQVLALVLRALHKTERWRCMLELGGAWMEICQGAADAVLVPLLLNAARNSGSATDVAALTAAQQALAADRNVALEELNRVRLLVLERLHGLTPLDAATSSAGSASPSRPTTATRKARTPDHVLLPAEYDKVVSQLKKRGEKGHMILALNELGDVHAYLGDWSQASEAWSSAVDALLGPYRVVETWRSKLELGDGSALLRRYGVHGLLLAATILGKLARYTYHGDLDSRLSCALLAAELLPAVFAGDIIHPQRRLDFAAYVPFELWPGAEVFEDPYRCNAAALASSLECLTSILQEQQLHLQTLPLLALWEHTSLHVAHNRASTVLARVTRVRVLAALGLMPQAATVLQSLIQGSNLPGVVLGPSQPLLGAGDLSGSPGAAHHTKGKGHAAEGKEGKESSSKESKDAATAAGADAVKGLDSRPVLYHADKWPQDPANAAFLQHVADAVMDPAVVTAYGPWLCGHLTLARAAFLAAAGGVVDCWVDGKPSALAAAVRAGPPPPVDPSTAASSAAAGTEPAGPPAAAAAGAVPKGAKPAASSTTGAAAGAGTAGSKAAVAVPAAAPPPPARTPAEFKLLDAAVQLLQGVVTVSCPASGMSAAVLGIPWADQGVPVEHAKAKTATGKGPAGKDKASSGSHGSTAKGGHGATKGGKGSPQKHGKGGKAGGATQQQPPEHTGGAEAAAAERRAAAAAELLAAQHQHLLIEALLQLAAVHSARWMPLQALPVCLAACEAVKHAAGSIGGSLVWVDGPLDSGQAEAKGTLLPGSSTWLAARWQLAHILLQLQHHGPCAAVCLKALTDAARAADVAWSARLLRVQAAALAAQEDYPQALNCYRAALTRLEEHGLPSSLVLPVQLEYAALCDEVGLRGDFDKLSATDLAVSTAAVQDMGLSEMMEHPKLTSIYLPAAATHLTALLAAASAATRRRQLASAERQLRTAADMLACCRCTPVHAAAVLTGLARVLRLQAALKLPDTGIAGAAPRAGSAAEPRARLHEQQAVVSAAQQHQQLVANAGSGSGSSRVGPAAQTLQLQQRRLHEAAHLLGAGLKVLISDAGSNPMLVRAALLELAAALVQAAATNAPEQLSGSRNNSTADPAVAAKVAAVLRAAHVTAGHVCKLLLDSHSLQPVQSPGTCFPDWLLELLKGHEQLQLSLQQEAAAAAAAAASKTGTKQSASAGSSTSGGTAATGAAGTASKQTATAAAADASAVGTIASTTPAVSDATLGRLAVCFYVQQLTAMSSGAAGLQQQQRAAEQALQMQPVLRDACAKFAAECCWADVPPEVAAVLQSLTGPVPTPLPALPTGSVFVQWYRQDGCWQSPSSWACHGTLPPTGQITSEALDSLPKQHPCVSCLYVLVMPAAPAPVAAATGSSPVEAAAATAAGAGGAAGGSMPAAGGGAAAPAGPVVLQGELVVSLERAKRVQLQVKAMRSRLEAPGKPTDIFAKPAPSTAELAAVKHSLECLLAAITEDDMPPPPADLPPPAVQPVQASITPAAAAAAAAGAPTGPGVKGAPAAAAGKPPPSAKPSAAGVAAGAAATAAAGKAVGAAGTSGAAGAAAAGANSAVIDPAMLQLEWRQVETWAKVEMLMDLEGGLQVTDAAVAMWLGGVLQAQLGTVGTQG